MPVPELPFLADDIVWAEVPIICWIVGATAVMLILYARFGWVRTHRIISRRRALLGASLVVAVVLAVSLYFASGQPVPLYF